MKANVLKELFLSFFSVNETLLFVDQSLDQHKQEKRGKQTRFYRSSMAFHLWVSPPFKCKKN